MLYFQTKEMLNIRVDDLGRIVIPKDVRKMLEIEEGQPMEMFVDSENNLILKKYKPGEE